MKIISSQSYINNKIVEQKMSEIENETTITLPVVRVGFDDLFVLIDGHHRLMAAKVLGIPVDFEVVEHTEGLTGEELLENSVIDCNWYYIESGKEVF